MSKGYPNHRDVETYSRNGISKHNDNDGDFEGEQREDWLKIYNAYVSNLQDRSRGNPSHSCDDSNDGGFKGEKREEGWLKIYNTYVSNLQDRSRGNSGVALPSHHSYDLSSSFLSDAAALKTNYSGPSYTSNRQYTSSKSAGQNREMELGEGGDDDDLEEWEEDSTNNVTRPSNKKDSGNLSVITNPYNKVEEYQYLEALEYRGPSQRLNYVPSNNRDGMATSKVTHRQCIFIKSNRHVLTGLAG